MSESYSARFTALGTTWNIDLRDAENAAIADKLFTDIRARLEKFENDYSRFRSGSLVSKIAKKAGTYRLSDDAEPMLDLYRKLYDATGGKVTPLIGKVLVDAGYDSSYSLQPASKINPAEKWDDVMKYDPPDLIVNRPVQLDFGAAGKGYAVDIVAEMIEKCGLKSYSVNAGGDIAYQDADHKPFVIGLEDPDDIKKIVGTVELKEGAIAGSAGNRRTWDRFHHIIDPDKAESPKHIKALWVTADSVMLADGLATALFFVEPQKLADGFKFECAILYADRSAMVSSSFPGKLFSA